MTLRSLKIVSAIIGILFFSFPAFLQGDVKKVPYSLEQLEKYLVYGQYTEDELIDSLLMNGINFYPDADCIMRLRNAGATNKIVETVLKVNRPPLRFNFSIFSMGLFKPVIGLPDDDNFLSDTKGSIGYSYGVSLEYRLSSTFSILFDIEHIDGEYWPEHEGGGVGDYDLWIYSPGIRLTANTNRRASLVSIFPRVYFSLCGGLYDVSYYPNYHESKSWKKYGGNAGIGLTLVRVRMSKQIGFALDAWGKYHHFGESEEYYIRQGISSGGRVSVNFDDPISLFKTRF